MNGQNVMIRSKFSGKPANGGKSAWPSDICTSQRWVTIPYSKPSLNLNKIKFCYDINREFHLLYKVWVLAYVIIISLEFKVKLYFRKEPISAENSMVRFLCEIKM